MAKNRQASKVKWVLVACALLLVFSLQGCLLIQTTFYTKAEWHQPGLLELLPDEGRIMDFNIVLGSKSKRVLNTETGRYEGESMIFTHYGDVQYNFRKEFSKPSSDKIFNRISETFGTLGLPGPILNPEFVFWESSRGSSAFWDQLEVWGAFPENGTAGEFEVFVHDSFKVAQKIDPRVSQWVRVNEEGNVSFRYVSRTQNHDEPIEERIDRVWGEMRAAFEELGLPEPELDPHYDWWEEGSRWSFLEPITGR